MEGDEGGESNEESAKSTVKKQTCPSLWHNIIRLGKTLTIAGAAIASAPVVIPPAIVGFAFSVPFGIYLAGLVYTDNVMRALLSSNSKHEIVKNQDAQVVAVETSPAFLYFKNGNPEDIENEHLSQDDRNEKYYDDGTYMNTDNEIYAAQEFGHNLSSYSDERSGVDICDFMQSSEEGKCDSELPSSSNTSECEDMIFPMHLESEVCNEAIPRDLEVQQASESGNGRNPYAEICYEEQKKLSELQEHGCGLGIEAIGLNEALHKLDERSIHKKDDINADDILEGIKEVDVKGVGHSFNVIGPIAEKERSGIREDFSVVEPVAEMEETDIRDDLNVVGPIAETGDNDIREDSNVVESIAKKDSDIEENSNAEPTAETEDSDIREDSNVEMEDIDIKEDLIVAEPVAETEETDISENSNVVEPIDEKEENDFGEDSSLVKPKTEMEEKGFREVSIVVDPKAEMLDSDFGEKFNIVEPMAEMEERDIIVESSVKPIDKMKESYMREENSMNELLDTNDPNSNAEAYDQEERKLHTLEQHRCDLGIEELGLNEALHKMEEAVLAENDRTNIWDNSSFIVLEPPVENEDRDDSKDEYSTDKDMKIDDNEFDSMALNVDLIKKQGALGDDGKTKNEIDSEATEIAFSGNAYTGYSELGYAFVHDYTIGETNLSKIDELNEIEAPGLDNQTNANKNKVIKENVGIIENESLALPFASDQPLDGNTERIDDQIGDEHMYHLAGLDRNGIGELEQEKDTSAGLYLEFDSVQQTNLKEGETNIENNEMDESYPKKVVSDDDMNMDTENEEEDNLVGTEISEDHPRETVIDESLQDANIELKDDINFDTRKEEKIPLLGCVETEDEAGQNIESFDDASALNNPTDENLNMEDKNYKVEVEGESRENQTKTSYLFAAVMPKEIESENVGHKNEMGTLGMKPQELTEDGSLMAKDDKPLEELPTVPEEGDTNFDTSLEKTEDEVKGKVEQIAVTVVALPPVEYENENQESRISIENHSSTVTSVGSRAEITIVQGSQVVHFHEEAIYGEDTMWEQIHALRTIIGCNADIHLSLTEELRSLYLLVGVEPPASLEEASDLIEITEKLEFLKSIIGVK